MGLNIKNEEVEQLAAEAARRFGESKTTAIKTALKERLERNPDPSDPEERKRRLMQFLAEVRLRVKPEFVGVPVSKEEREEILGYGPDGV